MEFIKQGLKNRAMVLTAVCAVLLIVVLILSVVVIFDKPTEASSKMTSFGLKGIGELATQAGYFTNVQVIQDSKEAFGITLPFTEKKYVFSYDGVVKAGVDFQKIELEVSGNEIHVKMPKAEIFGIQIDPDSYTVYYEGESVFNTLKVGDVNLAQKALEEEVTQKAIANGLLENAVSNAELLITGYLAGAFDMEQYTIVFEEGAD